MPTEEELETGEGTEQEDELDAVTDAAQGEQDGPAVADQEEAPAKGSGFKPITTQEELDRIIAERTERYRKKIKAYETRDQIATWKGEVSAKFGVPVEALEGTTKEGLEEHAKRLKPFLAPEAVYKNTVPAVPGEGSMPPKTSSSSPELAAVRQLFGKE